MFNNFVIIVNSFYLVHYESIQRRSGAVRYVVDGAKSDNAEDDRRQ